MGDRDRICGKCRFFEDAEFSDGFGECHRHAPRCTGAEPGSNDLAVWPVISSDDWCGEFEERRQ